MSNKAYPFRPVVPSGGNSGPFHPPPTSIGPGMLLTEQAVTQYNNRLRPLWGNVDGLPDDISIAAALAEFGVVGDGSNDDGPGLEEASQQDNLILQLPPGQVYRVSQNTVLSGRAIGRGGIIRPDNGVTVTIAGSFEAGLYQCFDTSAGGTIHFGPGVVETLYPQWFGAVGDGVVDDTVAIQSMYSTQPTSVAFPDGDYLITGSVVLPPSLMRHSMLGAARFIYEGINTVETPAVLIDTIEEAERIEVSVRKNRADWGFGNVMREDRTIGVLVRNTDSSNLVFRNIRHFYRGVHIIGDGDGSSYNVVYPGSIRENFINFSFGEINGGWANENKVIGGQFRVSSNFNAIPGTTLIDNGTTNNNTFIAPTLEGNSHKITVRVLSGYNVFINPRIESAPDQSFIFGPGTSGNVVIGGYGNLGPDTPIFDDQGDNIIIGSRGAILHGGGLYGSAALSLRVRGSGAYHAFRVQDLDGHTNVTAEGGGRLNFFTGDGAEHRAHPTVRIDAARGAIDMGPLNGDAAPVTAFRAFNAGRFNLQNRMQVDSANGGEILLAQTTLPTGNGPNVDRYHQFITANTSPTNVTDFAGEQGNKRISIIGGDGGNTTFVHGTRIFTKSKENLTLGDDEAVTFERFSNNNWYEV